MFTGCIPINDILFTCIDQPKERPNIYIFLIKMKPGLTPILAQHLKSVIQGWRKPWKRFREDFIDLDFLKAVG